MLLVLEALATPLLDAGNELLVGGVEHLSPEAGFLSPLRHERIEEGLVLAGGVHPTLDPHLLHHIDKTETRSGHADGANQASLVGVDGIGRTGDVVGARSPQIGDHRVQLGVRILTTQTADLVIDVARLHRTAARTVDPQHNRAGILVLEGRPQTADDIVGTGPLLVGNHPLHLDQRGMRLQRSRLLQARPG
ncbi:hypothetical protein D3C80_1309170 [compost metagenome]